MTAILADPLTTSVPDFAPRNGQLTHAPNNTPGDPAGEHPAGERPPGDDTLSDETASRSGAASADRGRVLLGRLFAGEYPFPPAAAAPLPPDERTAAEHDAASRAAGCPDLFIVHADPFAGERLIADLARALAAGGERGLVLSPNPGAADRITERLLKWGVPVIRALAADENPVRPAPVVTKATSAALGTARVEQAKREAAAALAAAEKRLDAFAPVSKAVARLREVNALLQKLDTDVAEHTARRDRVEAEVRAETDTPFALALAQLQGVHGAAAEHLTAELQTATAGHAEKAAELAKVKEHLAEAARKPGFFGRLFGGKQKPGAPDPIDVEKHAQLLESEVAELAARVAELQEQVAAATAEVATRRDRLVATEIAERRAAAEAALAAAENARTRARAEVAAFNKVIAAAVPGDDYTAAEQNLAAVRIRATDAARAAEDGLTRAVAEARIVVGTPRCLGCDPVFAALTDDPSFGLLVLDRAEELPEPEFPRLARLAARWVLVGDALPPAGGTAPRALRNGRPAEVPFVARVAKLLDRETWAAEGNRLVCRLAHLTPEQRRTSTREPLADRPEIELRFTAADGDLPAEIAFPGTTPLAEAKRFLFHTLGEVLLRPCGGVVWKTEPDAVVATWPAADADRDAVWIDLEPGVREKVTGTGLFAYTAAVRFDTAAGWDADRAAAWLGKYAPAAPVGRFAALPRTPGPRAG